MKLVAAASIVLLGYLLTPSPVLAADSCQECSAFHKACVRNHSQAARKVDYDICMKHCRKQN